MLRDAQGLEVTTNSPEAIAAIDRFIEQSLSYGNDAELILKAIEVDPACVIAHAAASFVPKLFAYLKQPLLPLTNNDLETFIGQLKKSRRHATGRRAKWK